MMPEHVEKNDPVIAELITRVPTLLHSLVLSLGTAGPVSVDRVAKVERAADAIGASWVSEHLCFSYADGIAVPALTPLPFHEEAVETAAANLRVIQSHLKRPLIVENVTNAFVWQDNQYTEAQFVAKVLEKADCGLLLDVTNLYINSKNFGYDPYDFLREIPAERVVQMHLAGHSATEDGRLHDTHEGGLHPDVLKLTEWVLRHTPCQALVVERDSDLRSFADLEYDLALCRDLYRKWRTRN